MSKDVQKHRTGHFKMEKTVGLDELINNAETPNKDDLYLFANSMIHQAFDIAVHAGGVYTPIMADEHGEPVSRHPKQVPILPPLEEALKSQFSLMFAMYCSGANIPNPLHEEGVNQDASVQKIVRDTLKGMKKNRGIEAVFYTHENNR